MDRQKCDSSAERFEAYLNEISSVIGHAARIGPLKDYCSGLLLPVERKSVESMAAVTAPERVAAQHQSLLHFVGAGGWSDDRVLAKVRELVLPQIERHGAIEAWIIDDTGMPKHGRHSVGVARQYCGQLGKQDNCQVAVSLSVANHHAGLPVAYRLYLPQTWSEDSDRRRTAGVPEDITFQTKPQIALDQLRWACQAGLPRGVVLIDAGYGVDTDLRDAISRLNLTYAVGVGGAAIAATTGPAAKRGSLEEIALSLPDTAWRSITWRDGTNTLLSRRFARTRVRLAHGGVKGVTGRANEWLLIEWPEDEKKPTKYWLSTLPEAMAFDTLVDIVKLHWRIERDYLQLKQEVGLGHFEGRGWRGFHHHATFCIAAYGFLISKREAFPPHVRAPKVSARNLPFPKGCRPRGAPVAA